MKNTRYLWLLLVICVGFVFSVSSAWAQAQTLEADVVVIGAGTAGLPAALTAADGGAKVIVFEKTNSTGGTGNMGMGPFAVESRLQREKHVALTKDQAFDIWMNYTHWRVNALLVKAYIDKSADTIDWLEKMGIQFLPTAYFTGSEFTWHVVQNQSVPGFNVMSAALKALADKAKEKGVQILFETPATKILKEGDRVVGVVGNDKSGNTVQVNAKAVIVATGGFGNNPEMIKKYTSYEWGVDLFSTRTPSTTGDGIRMAWEAGAAQDLEAMNIELTFGSAGGPVGVSASGTTALTQPRAIMVNLQGKRFYNEGLMGNTTFTGNAIAHQYKRQGFSIIDAAIAKYYTENGVDRVGMRPEGKLGNVESAVMEAVKKGNKNMYVANSLEELANKTGIDLAGLRETLNRYNEDCEKGYDSLFHKDHKYLTPLKQPNYYAIKLVPTGYGTLGGIKINEKAEVLSKEFKPIPGLYAAGVDANSVYADSYVFVLPGNTMGFALNMGRIAGENALKYIGK
jgi:fumarate reductase flavoprotein subunit